MITAVAEGEQVLLRCKTDDQERQVRLDLGEAWLLLQTLNDAYLAADAKRSERLIRERYGGAWHNSGYEAI